MYIYPNPVKNTLTVNGLSLTSNNMITITDIGGNKRLELNAVKVPIYSINIDKLKPGSYILNVKNENGTTSINFIKE